MEAYRPDAARQSNLNGDGNGQAPGPAPPDYYAAPKAKRLNPKLIPQELRDLCQLVVWRLRTRGGKPTKIPFRARNPKREASSTDSRTWASFDEAMTAYLEHDDIDGMRFVEAGEKHRTTLWRVHGQPTKKRPIDTTDHDEEGGHGDIGGHGFPPTRGISPTDSDVMMNTRECCAPVLGGDDVPHLPMSPSANGPREVREL